eukprot:m.32549 g.32549  ORF g.32549 m.32549 type:complete len:113 (+) comp8425_c0_seq2:227-565(+)
MAMELVKEFDAAVQKLVKHVTDEPHVQKDSEKLVENFFEKKAKLVEFIEARQGTELVQGDVAEVNHKIKTLEEELATKNTLLATQQNLLEKWAEQLASVEEKAKDKLQIQFD